MKKSILVGILVVEAAVFLLLVWPKLSNYLKLKSRLDQIPRFESGMAIEQGQELFLIGVVDPSSVPVFHNLVAFNDMGHNKSSNYNLRGFYTSDSLIVQAENQLAKINMDQLTYEVKVNALETKSQNKLNSYRQGENTLDHYYGIVVGDTVTFHGMVAGIAPLVLESASIVQLGLPDDLFWDFADSDDHHSMMTLVFSGWLWGYCFIGRLAE